MKKQQLIKGTIVVSMGFMLFVSFLTPRKDNKEPALTPGMEQIPADGFGAAVRYGRELMINTALYIGPEGIRGRYLGNRMNCTNCHQDAGTKAYSFNLMLSHEQYPQYRAREGKVLTLADRINNCIERPHNGRPLPVDSKEMVALLSYFRWINGFAATKKTGIGVKGRELSLPLRAASPQKGRRLFVQHCQVCHGANGQGQLRADGVTYVYPPLWGSEAFQRGSSMHRIIKLAQWLKTNMPYGKATAERPFLSDEEALDLAAFINDDRIHSRPYVRGNDYPVASQKAIDYDKGPFIDTFSAVQHKFGPFPPIVTYWKARGLKPVY